MSRTFAKSRASAASPLRLSHVVSFACAAVAVGVLAFVHKYLQPHSATKVSKALPSAPIDPIYWWVNPRPAEPPTWKRRNEPLDVDVLPSLSATGQKIRRVLIYSLVGGTCRGDDWRGDLPRYLLRYLEDARAVMIDASPSIHRNDWKCSECRHDTEPHFWNHHQDCEHYFGDKQKWVENPADMVVVFGAGRYMPCGKERPMDESCKPWRDKNYDLRGLYPDLNDVFTSGLVANDTLKIHIPIRRTHYLNEHPIFPFHHILIDNQFLKPLSAGSFVNLQEMCNGTEKGPNLIYIGRFTDSKGQLAFLNAVDPKHLHNYTVHFHGSNTESDNTKLFAKMNKIATKKEIDIVIHPPMEKDELYSRYCKSAGQIHYSNGDNVSTTSLVCSTFLCPLLCPPLLPHQLLRPMSFQSDAPFPFSRAQQNPRAVYEGLSAENPVFTTFESNLHSDVYQRSFVVSISSEDKGIFSSAFEYFMYQVRNPERVRPQIEEFVHDYLRPGAVYKRLCARLDICGDPPVAKLAIQTPAPEFLDTDREPEGDDDEGSPRDVSPHRRQLMR